MDFVAVEMNFFLFRGVGKLWCDAFCLASGKGGALWLSF